MSDTPRTDKALKANLALGHGSCVVAPEDYPECDPWGLARSLERKVNALEEDLSYDLNNERRRLWRDVVVTVASRRDAIGSKYAIKWADEALETYNKRFAKNIENKGHCKDCEHKKGKYCVNDTKINDDYGQGPGEEDDMMLYGHVEDGGFIVGDFFGCVHFKKRDVDHG